MALVWVIAGAGRGVGKTRLARGLCALLPDAVFAKEGHAAARPEKPERLLHGSSERAAFLAEAAPRAHAVLESNAAALEGLGDLVVFVEGTPRGTTRRPDAERLRALAGIVVSPDAPLSGWRTALDRALGPGPLCDGVIDLLLASLEPAALPPLAARTRLWLEPPGGRGLGAGIAGLLRAVEQHGTLREAALAAGMSYRHAWDLLRAAERELGLPLLASHPGGKGGGASSPTAGAERLARAFERLDAELRTHAERRLADLLSSDAAR